VCDGIPLSWDVYFVSDHGYHIFASVQNSKLVQALYKGDARSLLSFANVLSKNHNDNKALQIGSE